MRFLRWIMLLLALSCSYSTARFIPPGETVDLRDFESQFKCVVRLVISVVDGTELCGTGALMMAGTEWFVLTAAHLFVGDTYTFKDGDSLEVSGGSRAMKYAHTVTFALMKPTDEPQPWRQAVVYLPPDYDARRSRGAYDQDIAIIWLRGEFDALKTASDVDAATTKLHGEDVPIGQIVEVYGFGQDEMRGGQYQVIECSGGLPSTGFCYVPMRKINLYPVHGDSGAPIMCRDDTASSRAICGVHIGGYDADNSLQVGTKLTSYIQWFTETVLLCRFYSVTRPLPPVILVPSESETNRTSLQLSGGGGGGGDSQGPLLESNDDDDAAAVETALAIPPECQQLYVTMKKPMVDDGQARALAACINTYIGNTILQLDHPSSTNSTPLA